MSEEEKTPKEVKDEAKDEAEDVVDINYSLVFAQLEEALDVIEKQENEIDKLKKENAKYKDRINTESKKALINEISKKSTLDKKILAAMTLEQLLIQKSVLDNAKVSAIKSGTPLYNKPNAREALDTMFEKHQKKIRGEN